MRAASATSIAAPTAGAGSVPASSTTVPPSRRATASAAPASDPAAWIAPGPRGRSDRPGTTGTARSSSHSVGAGGPPDSHSTNPLPPDETGAGARPRMAGWSPPRSARRASPRPAATSATDAATTDVPEPPLGDHRARSTKQPPSGGRRRRGGRAAGSTERRGKEAGELARPGGKGRAVRGAPYSRRSWGGNGITPGGSYADESHGGGFLRPRQDRHRQELGAGLRPAALPRGSPLPLGAAEERLQPGDLPARRGRRRPHGAGPRQEAAGRP